MRRIIIKKSAKFIAYKLIIVLLLAVSITTYLSFFKPKIDFLKDFIVNRVQSILPAETTFNVKDVHLSFHTYGYEILLEKSYIYNNHNGLLDFDDITIYIDPLAILPFASRNLLNIEFSKPQLLINAIKSKAYSAPTTFEELYAELDHNKHLLNDFSVSINNISFYYEFSPGKQVEIIINKLAINPSSSKKGFQYLLHSVFSIDGNNLETEATLAIEKDEGISLSATILGLNYEIFKNIGYESSLFSGSNLTTNLTFRAHTKDLKAVENIQFELIDSKGAILANEYFIEELPILDLKLKGACTANCRLLEIDEVHLATDDFTLNGKANIDFENSSIAATTTIDNLAFNRVKFYWPSNYAPTTKKWISNNIKGGDLENISLELKGSLKSLTEFNFKTDIKGLSVKYAPNAPVVKDINATLTTNLNSLDFAIAEAAVLDSRISAMNGSIVFAHVKEPILSIDGVIEGPLQDVIDISFASADEDNDDLLGFEGESTAKLKLVMPLLRENYKLKDLKLLVNANINNLASPKLEDAYTVKNGKFKADLVDGKLALTGVGDINNLKAVDILFNKDLDTDDLFIEINKKLAWENIAALGYHKPNFLNKLVALKFTLNEDEDGLRENLSLDLTETEIALKELGIHKNAGVPAFFSGDLVTSEPDLIRINDYHLSIPNLNSKGMLILDKDHTLKRLSSSSTSFNNGNFSIEVTTNGSTNILLSGDSIDISSMAIADLTGATSKTTDFEITAAVSKILLKNNTVLHTPTFRLHTSAGTINKLTLNGFFAEKEKFELEVDKKGLSLYSKDAGKVFSGLFNFNNIYNGELSAQGSFVDNELRINGSINEFKLKKTSSLLKLFGLLSITNISLSGISDLFNQDGISFDKGAFEITFAKNLIYFNSIALNGRSMGIVAKGSADNSKNSINLTGTLFPQSLINSIIGNLPIIGRAFSSDESQFLSVSFSVTGALDDPDISANPLSIFTPGDLNAIFNRKKASP